MSQFEIWRRLNLGAARRMLSAMDEPQGLTLFRRLAVISATLAAIAFWLVLKGLYLEALIGAGVAVLFGWLAYLCKRRDRNA